MNDAQQLIAIVADLLSEDGENAEYDRACAEIVATFLGLSTDTKDSVLELLRARHAQQ
jgi:hypothetical protein